MSEIMLEVKDLTASYGQVDVLRGVELEVKTGEVCVILGANGAGKTTTLRSICNMPVVDCAGTVKFAGQDISKADTGGIVAQGMAHVPQGRGTFPELSTLENLQLGAYVRKDNEVDDDIDRWFQMFPVLKERKDQAAGSLSGGEQQMLAVSRALMSRPKLLLLDEPSLGLAPIIIEDLFGTFKQINEDEGTTMLIVEQNANLALSIAQSAYVLETGSIALSGPAAQLRDDPAVQEAYLGAYQLFIPVNERTPSAVMTLFLQRIIDGLQNGAIYSTVAIPMVLIFKATTLINFAQGELAMIGAFFAFVFAVQAFSMNVILATILAMISGSGSRHGD